MKNLFCISIIFCSASCFSQDSLSVLFIGNSYTYSNDLPGVLANLTQSTGDFITVDSKTNGGFTFQSHTNDPLTFSKINQAEWDFVVLQGQSQEPCFPTQQVNTSTLPYALQLTDSVYQNHACAQVMYFMTWGRQNGDPQWDSINTFDKMNKRLRDAYIRIADSSQASLAAVGSAWKYVRDNYPSINLYASDGSHPSLAGTYLSACIFYSSLFRKSSIGAPYSAGLDASIASILQQVASQTVLDSISHWKLMSPDSLTIGTFDYIINGNEVTFYPTFSHVESWEWDFGDGTNSTSMQPIHSYGSNGSYTVSLTVTGPCGTMTTLNSVTINSLETIESSSQVTILQLNNQTIKITTGNKQIDFKVYNCYGQQVQAGEINHQELITLTTAGIYYLEFHLDNHFFRKKIVLH
jgi:hypothetical protein